MFKIRDFLKRLIGRYKKDMSAILTGLMTIAFPAGFTFLMLGVTDTSGNKIWEIVIGLTALLFGIVLLITAYLHYTDEENKRHDEIMSQIEVNRQLLNEIRGLREDIRNRGEING
jgi:hypothetical protein